MSNQNHSVAVLGATPKPERFANKAIRKLLGHGFNVVPVHPKLEIIEDLPVYSTLAEIPIPIDTLT
ncbi:MAG: CoA-binding protein, partial [Enterobacterales bacterium]|nr:CoA-binding protein [Enterobacterales bacterium]